MLKNEANLRMNSQELPAQKARHRERPVKPSDMLKWSGDCRKIGGHLLQLRSVSFEASGSVF